MYLGFGFGDIDLSWTKDAIRKLVLTVDHFCEMASSFASRLRFLKAAQTLSLKTSEFKDLKVELRDDPNDTVMRDKVMPYIRDVRAYLIGYMMYISL